MSPDSTFPKIVAPIHVREQAGRDRSKEWIRVGVPFPRGFVRDEAAIEVRDDVGVLPYQGRRTASWPDGSVQWMIIDTLVTVGSYESVVLNAGLRASASVHDVASSPLSVTEVSDGFVVDTGAAGFRVARDCEGPLAAVHIGSCSLLASGGSTTRIRAADGNEYKAVVDRLSLDGCGPVVASVVADGGFVCGRRRLPLSFRSRTTFVAGSSAVRVEFRIRNPRAARHPGGLWDLGDPGSVRFSDLSIAFAPRDGPRGAWWYAEDPSDTRLSDAAVSLAIYQDSSGGENWDSPNHVDAAGKLTVSFSGYRVYTGTAGNRKIVAEGRRAAPGLGRATEAGWIAATTADFWQNFPKVLRLNGPDLSVGLFPAECKAGFELQGGEQKRHVVLLDFGLAGSDHRLASMQAPLSVTVAPGWIEMTGAVAWFTAAEHTDSEADRYVNSGVEGPHSFFAKREVIDEYGWRNYGDLYADHEAVHDRGEKPLVAHYNNQYDFVYGALVQYLRTGDERWRRLMEDAARHTIDIDVYHTSEDRAAYNGGLFWHTDHYKPAATGTHRSYSRHNGGRGYGGGPANEHNYTSGLLHYYYITGDPEARETVLELANWVIAMDDIAKVLRPFVADPTGLATCTTRRDYHGPGRGAGNSINALLDAYALTHERRYLSLAETLIQRCVHPRDDGAALRLDEPEERWSYLVFLQIVGKYLTCKSELGEFDYGFHYAHESLLRYASWMLDNEVPYKDVLHKVLIPTETWPAHDIRKCHVLNIASLYADEAMRVRLRDKAAFYFDRCLRDLLSFETAHFTRPLVILCVYGHVQAFFDKHYQGAAFPVEHAHDFGAPRRSAGQQSKLATVTMQKALRLSDEARRRMRYRLYDLQERLGLRA